MSTETARRQPSRWTASSAEGEIEVGLLTGGADPHYAFGLATALASQGVRVDFIGSDVMDAPGLRTTPHLNFLNLRGCIREDAGLAKKISRVLIYYGRLLRYVAVAKPRILHILWNNKFQLLDRTLLMLYYKLLGKTVTLTAHNVNAARRDSNDSLINRLTLKAQYRLVDHIFVHTEKMKCELVEDFGVSHHAVTVIPFGINNAVPSTGLTASAAKRRLRIGDGDRTILFFGRIAPYKGLEFLVAAFQRLAAENPRYRLIVAGELKPGCETYLREVQQAISGDASAERVTQRVEYIPDEETEVYFKAADVFALPYKEIFQSGVLFLGYSFGLPVVAADVGSLKEDMVEGRTGLLCQSGDPVDLARVIRTYFESDLYRELEERRQEIREYAIARHSWNTVSQITRAVYEQLLAH